MTLKFDFHPQRCFICSPILNMVSMLLPYRNDNPLAWCSRARGWHIRYLMIRKNSIGNICCPSLNKEDDVKALQVCLTVVKLQGAIRQAIDIPEYTSEL